MTWDQIEGRWTDDDWSLVGSKKAMAGRISSGPTEESDSTRSRALVFAAPTSCARTR